MEKIYVIQIKDELMKDDTWENSFAVKTIKEALKEIEILKKETAEDKERQIKEYGHEITRFKYRFEDICLF